mmetsp:Transcript_40814/g.103413  ORF Transcript_40814/g.103413 Transcript_40814/m.103413 type:complete len:292 (-) Transcript_40814:346-1221(-)
MQLVGVKRGRRAALEVAHVAALLRHDQRALKLAALLAVDAKVGGQLHRAGDALGNVAERAVAEDGGVERGEVVVGDGDHAAHVLLHDLRVLLHRLRDAAEDDARLGQLLAERGSDGHRIKHRVHRHVCQPLLLPDRDAQLFECGQQLGVHLVQAVQLLLLLGLGVVHHVLVVDGRVVVVAPLGLLHGQPLAVRAQAEVQQPLRLLLLGRDEAHRVLVQPLGNRHRLHRRCESILVRPLQNVANLALLLRLQAVDVLQLGQLLRQLGALLRRRRRAHHRRSPTGAARRAPHR